MLNLPQTHSPLVNERRQYRRRLVIAVIATVAVALGGSITQNALPAQAVATDTNPSFRIVEEDLAFILRQIQIAEAHAAGGALLCDEITDVSGKCVPSPALPMGLRTVDGSFNNLVAGQQDYGAADRVFPQLLPQEWRQADPAPAAAPPQTGDTSACADPASTCYAMNDGFVYDSDPRTISNLIVDQTRGNPAALNAAVNTPGSTEDLATGRLFIPNTSPDEGLSAPFNTWLGFFGQFFDHGLDLVNKGENGTIVVPLQPDDPLYVAGSRTNFLTLTRATRFNEAGERDPNGTSHNNQTTPYVDQNQTYTSHPSHQVFLREYELVGGKPVDTGRLLDGRQPDGSRAGLATWNDIKAQAQTVLGINLGDADVLDVPLLATDLYGNFLPGENGLPVLVTLAGPVEGNLQAPISTADAAGTGHAFLDDIAHGATPSVALDGNGDPVRDASGELVLTGYDNVTLGEHFATGDGRGNENIGLTAVHHVFHSEHNRMIDEIESLLNKPENAELKKAYLGEANNWPALRESDRLPGAEADNWSYAQRLFQAARFVTEMQYQHLVFEEYARTIQPSIDAVVFNENSYDGTIDPAIVAEFAHVVYRFGHSMMTEDVARRDFGTSDVPLLDGFLNPRSFDNDGALSPDEAAGSIVNGTTDQVANQIDEFIVDTLRNNLLGLPLDLATINLVRARDAGVPSLQTARQTLYAASGDSVLRPYENWVDFGLNLKTGDNFGRTGSNASLVNFVAAYGRHPSVADASSMAAKREAAELLVNGTPAPVPLSARFGGADRFDTAALLSRANFEPGVATAFVTVGTNFPDALSGGPAAAIANAPILLTHTASLPRATAAELARLQPQSITVLGGEHVVDPAVFETLSAYTSGPVTRLAGADRYETAAAVSAATFRGKAGVAYIATGANFPDALAASAAAGAEGTTEGRGPVLLVADGAIPAATAAELTRLKPTKIVVLGGTSVISPSVAAGLRKFTAGKVVRIAGADRYGTAIENSRASLPKGATTAYIATGANFPDALAAAPVAAVNNAPLLLVPSAELLPAVKAELRRLGVTKVVVLGGDAVVNVSVQADMEAAIDPNIVAPDDRLEFMNGVGSWAADAAGVDPTGLGDIDMWVGGLAEALNPFGGMLGSTFNVVFERQLENLQFGDRFYYLFRNQGQQLFAALEASSFSDLIKRNTAATDLPANIFSVQDPMIDLDAIPNPLPADLAKFSQMLDGTYRWAGDEHIEIHGTEAEDRMRGGQGDDSLFGNGGNDRIEGGDGNDLLLGNSGDDILTDSFGDDNLKGGLGNDALDGGPGINLLFGSHGDDYLVSGGDTDNTSFAGTGDDITVGGAGRMIVFGGEGNDWVEGGKHGDLLQGDNGNQFQNDTTGGADVVIGGSGNDDVEGEGGDDILVGQALGTDRYLGNLGFDWLTYYGTKMPVTADMMVNRLTAPGAIAVRARFDQLEALSGGSGDDTLRGSRKLPDEYRDTDAVLEKATEASLDLVAGLEALLRPGGGHEDYALRFMDNPLALDSDGVSNILIGGAGNDTIEGREGDDFLDGDAYLRTQLVHLPTGQKFDSARELHAAIFAGEINPGDIDIERAIEVDQATDSIDTVVYLGSMSEYSITETVPGSGYYRVLHAGAAEPEESEGADIVRNFERIQFSDGCYEFATGAACVAEGAVALSFEAPLAEDKPVTATMLGLGGAPFDTAGISNVRYHWYAGEPGDGNDIGEWELLQSTGPNPGTLTESTWSATDAAVGSVLRVVVNYTGPDGRVRAIVSETTADTVANVNDVPSEVVLRTAEGLHVGAGLLAQPFTDGDGLAEAAEAGIVYEWQRSLDGFATHEVIAGAGGTAYLLQAADLGAGIRVVVRYTDDLGTEEANTSAAVGPVTDVPVAPSPEPVALAP
ncbi:peroxidase family protein [Microterricola viridarii]|uniref:Hemolysin-type calcium-binding repeat-containing protein n=1 Tax=Microterricola viridarii TaxID=412690 RepID=A0A1H1S7M0_9MICO|nr:peroxidase family protein [Microterricola viridarii]SDS43299.1 Hemolysin-type calcium-binding repeat-containing protein [Microterricola viridarii]